MSHSIIDKERRDEVSTVYNEIPECWNLSNLKQGLEF